MDNSLAVRMNELNRRLLDVIKPKLAGETNRYIAKKTGMTESQISLLLRGKQNMTMATLSLLCDCAKVDIWSVWSEAEEASK
jgi:transcriptional regulator with XRE-family HTH domain